MNDLGRLVPAEIEARAQTYKRAGVAFGDRFFMLIFVGLVWLGPAFVDVRFVYAMLVWDALVIVAWLIDLASLAKPEELAVKRSWRSPVALSMPSEVDLTLTNSSSKSISAVLIDNTPTQVKEEPVAIAIEVRGRSESSGSYGICPRQRGDAKFGDCYVRYQGTMRIAERWVRARLEQTVTIYPNLDEAKRHSIYLLRSRQIAYEKRRTRLRGIGREFESLREYRVGDEYRDICWTAAARRAKLVTRLYQIERSQTVWIVIDSGRLMRARVGGVSKLDQAVNSALSLAQVALYSGDRVGLIAYGRGVRHNCRRPEAARICGS